MDMNMKRMMQQAKAMQKQMHEALEKFNATKFEYDYKGLIKTTIYGNLKIEKIEISPDLIDKDDIDTLQEMLSEAISEANQDLMAERKKITQIE